MKTIYPQETLDLLAEMDELLDKIKEEYQQTYPDPPEFLREVLGDQLYTEKWHVTLDKRRRAILEDPYYQACIRQKTKIIMISPCTYQLDTDEIQQKPEVTQESGE